MQREPRVDADGVRRQRREDAPGLAWVVWPVFALVILAVGMALWFLLQPVGASLEAATQARPAPGQPAGPGSVPTATPSRSATHLPLQIIPGDDLTPEQREAVQAAAQAALAEAAAAPTGERSGLALFPPPGTEPLRKGLVVPEGFELPPGYVRHYQVTDDGKGLKPILMFHPDFVPLDDKGLPLPVPDDRIVPPSMAPPGMPLETLELPDEPAP